MDLGMVVRRMKFVIFYPMDLRIANSLKIEDYMVLGFLSLQLNFPWKGFQRNHQGSSFLPKSPYMSFLNLMSRLAKYLGPSDMDLIAKYHCAFWENKITRPQVIRKLRQIAGDDLLKAVIKLSINKKLEASRDGRSYGAVATNPNSTKSR